MTGLIPRYFERYQELTNHKTIEATPAGRDAYRVAVGEPAEPHAIDLREALGKYWARKRLIFVSIIGFGFLAFAIAKLIPPVYVSDAFVLINITPPNAVAPSEPNAPPGFQGGPEIVQSESFVLGSRALASETIKKLDLDRDPELNPAMRKPSLIHAVAAPVLAVWGKFDSWLQDVLGSPEKPEVEPDAVVVDNFLKRLLVTVQQNSNVIDVSFKTKSPRLAAVVPNTLIELYIDQRRDARSKELAQKIAWLDRILPELRQKMVSSQLALAEYRKKSGLASQKSPAVVGQELSDVATALAAARAQKAQAQARLQQFEALFSAHGSAAALGSAASASESPILQNLQQQAVGLEAQLAAARHTLGPNNPTNIQLNAQLRQVRGAISRERSGFVRRMKAELAAAEASEATLTKRSEEYTREFGQVNGGDTRLASLVDQATNDQKTYDQYVALANDAHSSIGHLKPDASFVSRAAVPLKPHFPNTPILVLVGLALGAGIGFVLAAILDGLLGGLRSKQQVEETLGVRCLGLVPRLSGFRRNRIPVAERQSLLRTPGLHRAQDEAFGQAVRSVQLKLRGSDPHSHCPVVLVSAALPEEGKTWVAASLAASLAAEGLRAALVDCDLRRPAVHRMFSNGARGPGLTDFFNEGATFEDIIHHDSGSGVDYVPVGASSAKAAWRITSDRLRPVISRLRERYSFVILDSAPVLVGPETAILAQIAQRTVFVIRWGKTPPSIVQYAMAQLLESGGSDIAAVLSMVDLKRAARYGDTVAGAYKRLQGYYGH